eukprot:2404067-Pyramimonas_sp.AAC.2
MFPFSPNSAFVQNRSARLREKCGNASMKTNSARLAKEACMVVGTPLNSQSFLTYLQLVPATLPLLSDSLSSASHLKESWGYPRRSGG